MSPLAILATRVSLLFEALCRLPGVAIASAELAAEAAQAHRELPEGGGRDCEVAPCQSSR